jgi:hypothetical protein
MGLGFWVPATINARRHTPSVSSACVVAKYDCDLFTKSTVTELFCLVNDFFVESALWTTRTLTLHPNWPMRPQRS